MCELMYICYAVMAEGAQTVLWASGEAVDVGQWAAQRVAALRLLGVKALRLVHLEPLTGP